MCRILGAYLCSFFFKIRGHTTPICGTNLEFRIQHIIHYTTQQCNTYASTRHIAISKETYIPRHISIHKGCRNTTQSRQKSTETSLLQPHTNKSTTKHPTYPGQCQRRLRTSGFQPRVRWKTSFAFRVSLGYSFKHFLSSFFLQNHPQSCREHKVNITLT